MSMAAAARSPSPSPGPAARPCCGGLRRSADSSPFRPAASPPGSPQRSSSVCRSTTGCGGRASPRASFGDKENDHPRDAAGAGAARAQAQHKVRSSGGGVGAGGAAKSFMAPTISAASKAVAPSASPRKKILGDRNDHVVASSPGDHLLAYGKPRGGAPPPTPQPSAEAAAPALGAARRLRLSLDGEPAAPEAAPVASRGDRHSFGGEEEADRVGNAACNVHHHHHDAASVDADAVAPYDPKTNYLSPRPRFLRYKPNPRVELYRSGGSVRRLEDGFASESSEEAEADTATTTTTDAEDEPTEEGFPEESSSVAAPSEARAEPAAPADSPLPQVLTLEEEATSTPARAPPTPEPKPETPRASVLTPEHEPAASPARVRPKKKKWSALRFLLAPLALVLFVAAAFVCVPPPPGSPVMLNTSLAKVSDFLSVQELHPVELAARLKQWSSSSLDLVTSYWEALASSQEQEFFGPHVAANLSAAAAEADADHGVGFYYSASQMMPISVEELETVGSESDNEAIADPDVEEMTSFSDAEVEEEPIDDAEIYQEAVSERPSLTEEVNESSDAEVEVFDAEMAEEVSGNRGEEIVEEVSGSSAEEISGEDKAAFSENSGIPSQSTPEPEQAEAMDESSLQQNVQTDESEGDHSDSKEDQEAHHSVKLGSDMWPGYLDKISNPAAIGAALAAIIVPTVLAYLYMRQKQARVTLDSNEPAEQVQQDNVALTSDEQARRVEQAESLSGSGSSEGHVVARSSQFQYTKVEESERFGGSGASQYSSSLSSGLGRRRKVKGEENLNLEPGSRRDSTAQSTSSYGSFTTYEKIPAKRGNEEDEAMTPVRRSSRLRQVKSPEA